MNRGPSINRSRKRGKKADERKRKPPLLEGHGKTRQKCLRRWQKSEVHVIAIPIKGDCRQESGKPTAGTAAESWPQ